MRDDELTRLFGSLDAAGSGPDPVFAGELFDRLQAEVAGPARSARRPWMILLAAALVVAVLGAGAALGSGLLRAPWLVVTVSPTAEPSASGSIGPVPSGTLPPATDVPASPLEVGSLARTAVDGLRLRAEPGLGGSEVGTLAAGELSFVAEGPREVDGYQWWLLAGRGLAWQTGCAGPIERNPWNCPVWYGWAAGASLDAEAWIAPVEPDCPRGSGRVPADYGHPPLDYLACFGGESRTYIGWLPEIPEDAGPGGNCPWVTDDALLWLACDHGYTRFLTDLDEHFQGAGIALAVNPASGIDLDAIRGSWVSVTGHHDDLAAAGCTFEPDPGYEVLRCRARFVVESIEPTAAP